MRSTRWWAVCGVVLAGLILAGCPKGQTDFKQGKRAEMEKDYDSALIHYQNALKANPGNTEYQLKVQRLRFESSQSHVDRGHRLRAQGQLQLAAAEFEKALAIDPSSIIAEQELKKTLELIAEEQQKSQKSEAEKPATTDAASEGPPRLAALPQTPISLRATNDAKMIFDTIGKLAGISMIFDPDFASRRIPVDFVNVTLAEALDLVALQTKTFWKPVTSNAIFIIPDTPQKRKDYEEQVVRTFYLSNTLTATELTEVVTALRNLLDMRRIQQNNTMNAIVVRDTPDKVAVAEKVIRDIDKAKPEVMVQVSVLQARRDRLRDLGIQPDTSPVASLLFTPRNPTTPGTDTKPPSGTIRLSDLQRLSSADYSLTLPGARAFALLSDSTTKILQNPEVRASDGQTAKLRIGDRIPVATGSFQPGLGAVGVNPLVNTQFQYQDVGVNVELTPHVHPNREVSLKVKVEISQQTATVNIGGINQPVFSQRTVEHDIRLREGEVNVLGGVIERTDRKVKTGWPGLSQVPFLRYFFSDETTETLENEVLIVLTPRIVRVPEITAANLRSVDVGTDTNVKLRMAAAERAAPAAGVQPTVGEAKATPPTSGQAPTGAAMIRFDPNLVNVPAGQTFLVNVVVDNVKDLFSLPFLVQYDPKVIQIDEVRHGGFMSSDGQAVAIVQRVDQENGVAIISLIRPPGTSGTSGSGAVVALVARSLGKGQTTLRIPQVNARTAKQDAISLATGECVVVVQ